jgi:hypothetical protein
VAGRASFLLGRGLQALGLVLLPVGLWHGISGGGGMTAELAFLGAGAASFLLGAAILRPHRGA